MNYRADMRCAPALPAQSRESQIVFPRSRNLKCPDGRVAQNRSAGMCYGAVPLRDEEAFVRVDVIATGVVMVAQR
jgi:hypothetical protein